MLDESVSVWWVDEISRKEVATDKHGFSRISTDKGSIELRA
jgi:hypothetical protein